MSAEPGYDVRIHLAAAAIGFTSGTNIFDGPERAYGDGVPHEAAFVTPYGGPQPQPFIGGTTEQRFPQVQVLYRSGVDDYNGGEAKARAIRDALHHQSITRATGGSYTDCRALQSAPLFLGIDEQRRTRWAINVELWHRE